MKLIIGMAVPQKKWIDLSISSLINVSLNKAQFIQALKGLVFLRQGDERWVKSATKKELAKHVNWIKKGLVHSEGKHFCDCRTRNYRRWLGVKLHGSKESAEADSN